MGRDAVCHRELQDESSPQASRKPWGQSCTSATRAFLAGHQAERDLGPRSERGRGRERLTVAGLCASHLPSRLASLSPSPLPGFSISFLGWFCARPEVTVRTVSLAPRWPSAYWTPQVCAPCGERTLPAQQASQTHGAAGFGIHVDPQDPRAA